MEAKIDAMKIKIDQKIIEEKLTKDLLDTIIDAFDSYSIRAGIEGVVKKHIIEGVVIKLLSQAAKNIDTNEVGEFLTQELKRHLPNVALHLIKEGLSDTIHRLREADRAKLREEFKK